MPAMRAIILRASLGERSPAAKARLATKTVPEATIAIDKIISKVRFDMIHTPEGFGSCGLRVISWIESLLTLGDPPNHTKNPKSNWFLSFIERQPCLPVVYFLRH